MEGSVEDHLFGHLVRVGNVGHAGFKLVEGNFKFVPALSLHVVVYLSGVLVLDPQAFLLPSPHVVLYLGAVQYPCVVHLNRRGFVIVMCKG